MEIRTCEQYVLAELERVRAERDAAERRADELDAELERCGAAYNRTSPRAKFCPKCRGGKYRKERVNG